MDPMESSTNPLKAWPCKQSCAERREELAEILSQHRWTAPPVHGVTWNKPLRNSYIEPLSWGWIQTALRLLIPVTLAKGSHGNSPFSWRNSLNSVWTAHHSPSSHSGSITFFGRFLNSLMLDSLIHWEMNLTSPTTETYHHFPLIKFLISLKQPGLIVKLSACSFGYDHTRTPPLLLLVSVSPRWAGYLLLLNNKQNWDAPR